MTTLYLVRHGETTDNVAQIIQGQRHGELTSRGKAQMQDVAIALEDVHAQILISSDLERANESAQIIGKRLSLPVRNTSLLRERDWGDFTGRFIPELKGLPMPDNVEKMEELLARAKAFLDSIRNEYEGKTIIAVGHGIINKAIQAVHYGKLTREIPKMANAEYRILQL